VKLIGPENEILLGGRIITAIHMPGHSPGSVVYLTESDGKKVLFGQDVHGPLAPMLKSNRKDYLDSLKKMIRLDSDILCEGHFGVYRGKEAINKFISSFL
jgi:glyoxylase-like metal-dependent hydrolase (beta-lactamase superfamily II)